MEPLRETSLCVEWVLEVGTAIAIPSYRPTKKLGILNQKIAAVAVAILVLPCIAIACAVKDFMPSVLSLLADKNGSIRKLQMLANGFFSYLEGCFVGFFMGAFMGNEQYIFDQQSNISKIQAGLRKEFFPPLEEALIYYGYDLKQLPDQGKSFLEKKEEVIQQLEEAGIFQRNIGRDTEGLISEKIFELLSSNGYSAVQIENTYVDAPSVDTEEESSEELQENIVEMLEEVLDEQAPDSAPQPSIHEQLQGTYVNLFAYFQRQGNFEVVHQAAIEAFKKEIPAGRIEFAKIYFQALKRAKEILVREYGYSSDDIASMVGTAYDSMTQMALLQLLRTAKISEKEIMVHIDDAGIGLDKDKDDFGLFALFAEVAPLVQKLNEEEFLLLKKLFASLGSDSVVSKELKDLITLITSKKMAIIDTHILNQYDMGDAGVKFQDAFISEEASAEKVLEEKGPDLKDKEEEI